MTQNSQFNFGINKQNNFSEKEDNKKVSLPHDSMMFIGRGVANDVVIEDPNEQTQTEFQTKRTIQMNDMSKSNHSIIDKSRANDDCMFIFYNFFNIAGNEK